MEGKTEPNADHSRCVVCNQTFCPCCEGYDPTIQCTDITWRCEHGTVMDHPDNKRFICVKCIPAYKEAAARAQQ